MYTERKYKTRSDRYQRFPDRGARRKEYKESNRVGPSAGSVKVASNRHPAVDGDSNGLGAYQYGRINGNFFPEFRQGRPAGDCCEEFSV